MSKKREQNRRMRTSEACSSAERSAEAGAKNSRPHPAGRPPRELCFTDIIRAELKRKKKFRRADGSIMEASELELIAMKVVRELRNDEPVNNKLLGIILDRLEGKPKESVEIDGKLEVAQGLDAKDVLIQRLNRILEIAEDDSDEEVEDADES